MWGGCDCVDLAKQYGTPLYVMDETMMREVMRRYRGAALSYYPGLRVAYAAKAFLCGAMAQLVAAEGLWMDVVSGGELHLALAAGFPAERILFHGNNKSHAEIEYGVQVGVGRFIVDNREELDRLDQAARSQGKVQDVLLRFAPGIEPHTHRSIQTGQVDSKFGFTIAGGVAHAAILYALTLSGIRLRGLHCHIGSQIREVHPFAAAGRAAAKLAWAAWADTGYLAEEINLGGGWAAGQLPGQEPPPVEHYVEETTGAFRRAWRRHGKSGVMLGPATAGAPANAATRPSGRTGRAYAWPALYIEPGRSIVADAGITLYTAGVVKPVPGYTSYVLVDGGMSDNPRPALYGALYHAVLANRSAAGSVSTEYILAGKACESGDILIRGASLPEVVPGDLIAVFATGAYNHSMSSNYNRLPRPPVVFVGDGNDRLVVRRETFADLAATDLFADQSPQG